MWQAVTLCPVTLHVYTLGVLPPSLGRRDLVSPSAVRPL